MKVYNKSKTQIISNYDLNKGYLVNDKIFVKHHESVAGVKEKYHYETIKNYPNGGKDVRKVIDAPAIEYKDAYDEYEDILVYIPYTTQELANMEISSLKDKLSSTDYLILKYLEGLLSLEEYEKIKSERLSWRNRINELESLL